MAYGTRQDTVRYLRKRRWRCHCGFGVNPLTDMPLIWSWVLFRFGLTERQRDRDGIVENGFTQAVQYLLCQYQNQLKLIIQPSPQYKMTPSFVRVMLRYLPTCITYAQHSVSSNKYGRTVSKLGRGLNEISTFPSLRDLRSVLILFISRGKEWGVSSKKTFIRDQCLMNFWIRSVLTLIRNMCMP